MEKGEELETARNEDLTEERREDLLRDEIRGWSLGVDALESLGTSHCRYVRQYSLEGGREWTYS